MTDSLDNFIFELQYVPVKQAVQLLMRCTGVDWSLVAEHVNMDNAYDTFQDPSATQEQQQGWRQKLFGCFGCMKQDSGANFKPQTDTPHGHVTGLIRPCMDLLKNSFACQQSIF